MEIKRTAGPIVGHFFRSYILLMCLALVSLFVPDHPVCNYVPLVVLLKHKVACVALRTPFLFGRKHIRDQMIVKCLTKSCGRNKCEMHVSWA